MLLSGDTFEAWTREQGFNLLYDGVMKNYDKTRTLLSDLAQEGYGKRVVLSVEVPMQTSLEQNALRWQRGRAEFDAGRDPYGGRMAPEPLIHALFPQDPAASFSVARSNAERLHAEGRLTGLIELDRGQWQQEPSPGPHAPAMQFRGREAGMQVSTVAARSKSVTGKRRPSPPAADTQQQPGPGPAAARRSRSR